MATKGISFEEAIENGEYDPKFLSNYDEFNNLSPHSQLQYIRRAIENRRKQLITQWAEMDRAIDLRLKPNLERAKKNVEKKLNELEEERERLLVEYSDKF